MIQLLQDCRNQKTSNAELLDHYDDVITKGLIERGLLESIPYTKDETKIRYSVTQLGKEYLEHYFPGI